MITSRLPIDCDAVASHYDELDHFYRDVWGDHVHHGLWRRGDETRERAVEQLIEVVAKKAHAGAGVRVCDIGCGYGATARFLADRGAEVTAITISPAQFAVAIQQPTNNPRFVLGDWLANQFAEGAFDAAIAIESSEHMPDIACFFKQAHRILRPGGRLIVCAWLAAEGAGSFAQRWLLEPICREGRMPRLGDANDYRAWGEGAAFRLEEHEDVTRGVMRTWPAIVRRLSTKLAANPRYLRFLLSRHAHNRIFALTILRIWIAYQIGAMRYGVFTFVKP